MDTAAVVIGRDAYSSQFINRFIEMSLASLPRSDQRHWGDRYIRALLSVPGRKTMRTLAGDASGTVEQSFQQFISRSPWDWIQVRRELAARMQYELDPQAWVVETEAITKAGDRTVGVDRQFVAKLGRVANCQQTVGVWMVDDQTSCPVNWSIALPSRWTNDPRQRRRADIPDEVTSLTPAMSAVEAVVTMAETWNIPRRPVIMEVEDADLEPVASRLAWNGIPYILRVNGSATLLPATTRPLPAGFAPASAQRLVTLIGAQRRPVEWVDQASGTRRVTPMLATGVQLPGGGRGTEERDSRPLALLAAWTDPVSREPSEFWVTNIRQMQPGSLFTTAKLARRVHSDMSAITTRLGIRDFEGRSYRGWHHHVTLVSIAHAITVLSATRDLAATGAPRYA